ncbi:MAG: HdeD family acid-resistance protein [Kineosporiaceae bacterium]
MADPVREDIADTLGGVGRHWGWLLAFGIVTVLAGIVALVWPGKTLVVIAVLFGIQLIVAGIFEFVGAFGADESGGRRVLYVLLGVLSIIVGVYAIRHTLVTLGALALLLGIYWVVHGFVVLFVSISDRATPSRGWAITMAILSIIAGFIVLVYPSISLLTLTFVLGFWLIIYGVMEIFLAFRLRSVGAAAAHLATA